MQIAKLLTGLLIASHLTSCSSPGTEQAKTSLPTPPAADATAPAPAFRDTLMLMAMRNPDTTGVRYTSILDTIGFMPLIPEASIVQFKQTQALPFVERPDTVINDERGVFVGERMSLGPSYVQWLDRGRVSSAVITDLRIRLTHGLRVGMTRQEVQQKLGIAPLESDTVVFETGYMLNHCTLFFWQGRLHTVCLEDMPD